MSKADNNLDVESGELRDISLITFINRKPASRRHVCFPSASFDYTSTNIALNTLIGRKRSRDSDNWARNLQKHNGTKDCEEAKVAKIEKEAHLKEAERARSQMTAD
uniref:CACTA en-spm transposon protein n=1 Tax=Strongyloides stercoralis TaxID=6248 RepID=A0A0K0EC31_STRER